jgi:hypothetical protein
MGSHFLITSLVMFFGTLAKLYMIQRRDKYGREPIFNMNFRDFFVMGQMALLSMILIYLGALLFGMGK